MLGVQIPSFNSEFLQNGNHGNNTDNYSNKILITVSKSIFFLSLNAEFTDLKLIQIRWCTLVLLKLNIPSTKKTQMIFVLLLSLGRLGFQGSTETFSDFAN